MRSGICFSVLVALGPFGCSATGDMVPLDGGADAKSCLGSQSCDKGAGKDDPWTVRECRNGVLGDMVASCATEGACSRGRCMSAACADADAVRNSILGCVFYTAEVDNVATDAAALTSLLVTNPNIQSTTVTLERLSGGAWMVKMREIVPGGGAARLSVAGLQIMTEGEQDAAAMRVISDRPVTVAQIESDDSDEHAQSSGGTMLLPTHVLGSHYLVTAYAQAPTGAAVSPAGAPDGAGRLLIVGTQPRTTVTVNLSPNAPMAVTGEPPGQSFSFPLGDGAVYQAWTGADLEDLSGTEISADQPIAVFSGNIVTTYGRTAPGIHSPDMAFEQLPPIASWSFNYVAAALPPQAKTCDTLLGQDGASIWRVLAGNDPVTTVDFHAADGSAPPSGALTMMPGQVAEFVATGDFFVNASGPVLVTQGIDCEPSLSLAVSADQMLDDLTFAALPWFDQLVAVVRHQGAAITLDGMPVPDTLFTPAGGGFEVSRLHLPACTDRVCTHRLQGQFGMTMRGMDVLASYALTAPSWNGCHDSMDLNCPQ
jgi:hypothetical protein